MSKEYNCYLFVMGTVAIMTVLVLEATLVWQQMLQPPLALDTSDVSGIRSFAVSFAIVYLFNSDIKEPLPVVTSRSVLNGELVVRPHNFPYIINPGSAVCKPEVDAKSRPRHVQMLIYVHSATANLEKRQMIRQTWGEVSLLRRYQARLVFILGRDEDPEVMELVKLESQQHADIVQEDFLDTYRNLSLKAIAALKWTATYCPKVAYILKTDDDILVNIHRVVNYIRRFLVPRGEHTNIIVCKGLSGASIVRDPESKWGKWYVTMEELKGNYYRPYCAGGAFILSGDVPRILYQASLVTSFFFWIDDYYVTGELARLTLVSKILANEAFSLSFDQVKTNFESDVTKEKWIYTINDTRLWHQLWHKMNTEALPL